MTWRDKTCERCVFRVGDECRRFPPTYNDGCSFFPEVMRASTLLNETHVTYSDACAEYAELIEPQKTTEDNGTV